TSVDVVIPITDDAISESPEDFTVDGTVTSGNTSNTDPSGTVTITDNDSVNVTIGDVTVGEGDGTATVPVTLSTPSAVDTVIDIVTTTGTAGTSDYTATTTTVTIPAGSTSVDVVIPITDDAISESPEDFTVDGTVTSGNTSNTDPSGTVTITDNDSVNVTIGDVTVGEGDGTATVPVTLSAPSAVDTVIDIVTTTGTAGTSDYTATTITVTIPAGSTSVDVSIPITDDTTDEPNENFTVDGTVTSGNTSNTDPSGTVTIIDNDDSLPIANNDGGTTDPGVDIIIDITINDTDSDGTIDDLTLDLDPNSPGQQSTFTVLNEGTFTDNGDGTVTFSPAPGYTNGTTTITYTVNDDDGNISNEATITVVVPLCTSTVDTDGDGLTDCEETTGIDDPGTPENPNDYPGGPISNPNDPCDPGTTLGDLSNPTWRDADCDGDGVTNGDELTPPDGETPTNPNDPCD
ncbi:Calx-beta domain-containing protein, partial [uncultured Algibacter sp.]|uniref:Calx-beta domain-containing protein n=1 Tax=uncultured Algibacter sp. TaxID=298659 RepID=UPI0026044A25